MAGDPFGGNWMSPELQRMLSQGKYRKALEKTGEEVAEELAKQGKRIVKPVGEVIKNGFRRAGWFAEAGEAAELTESVELSLEALEGAEVAAEAMSISEALAAGWGSVMGVAAAAATSEVTVPLICFCLLAGLLLASTAKPAIAEPLRRDSSRQRLEVRTAGGPIIPWQQPKKISDSRLKHNIVALKGRVNNLRMYEFSYLGDDRRFVGVMAQDLLQDDFWKHAVAVHPSGWLAVDYEVLGLDIDPGLAMLAAGEACVMRVGASMPS